MAVNSKHPLYLDFLPDWCLLRVSHKGQRAVKEEGVTYLPATTGMIQDGMGANQKGAIAYNSYRLRAHFPDVIKEAVEAMVGVMHHKPAVIEVPAKLEPMLERATLQSESLQMLLQRINEQQLITGRVGCLLDVEDGENVPYVAMYNAERIINWDDGKRGEPLKQALNLVTLEETEYERKTNSDFEWENKEKYRLLILGDPNLNEKENIGAFYFVGTFSEDTTLDFNAEAFTAPNILGRTLEEIPFVFVNTKDIVPNPDDGPLLGLANLAMTIYRGEADYRQGLFMQGQDTLVVIGGEADKDYRVGANATLVLQSTESDAKFIGVTSDGLAEQREALENDKSLAAQKGGQLLDSVSREAESGKALKIRVAARTATLNQIANTGAFALEQLLKIAARWVGADENEVVVTPNLDFTGDGLDGKELLDLTAAKNMGAPLSQRSIHNVMRDKDLTVFTFEEELAEIETEEPMGMGTDEGGDEENNTGEQDEDEEN